MLMLLKFSAGSLNPSEHQRFGLLSARQVQGLPEAEICRVIVFWPLKADNPVSMIIALSGH